MSQKPYIPRRSDAPPSRVIRVDDELYEYIAQFGEPLVDTPNTILKQIIGLQPRSEWFKSMWGEDCMSDAGALEREMDGTTEYGQDD